MRSSKVNPGDSGLASQYNNLRSDAQPASYLYPHQQATPNMTLYVEPGIYWIAGARIVFAGGNSPTFSAPGSNNIINLLVIDASGTLSIVVGTSGASPAVPTYPKDKIVIAEIYIRAASTSLKDADDGTNGYVYNDVRPFVNNGKYISQNGAETYAVDSGSANTYVANFTPAFTSLVDGMEVSFRAANGNTSASTLNVNSLGALNIFKNKNLSLIAGDIIQNQTVIVVYDSVDNCWQMQSQLANAPTVINIFGDGSDGNVTISSNTSLTQDMYYSNLTINNGVVLNPNGYKIHVKLTLTQVGTGKIARTGNSAGTGNSGGSANNGSGNNSVSGGSGASGLSDGTMRGSGAGKNGASSGGGGGNGSGGSSGSSGNSGDSKSACIGSNGVNGGSGGNGGSGTNYGAGGGGGQGGGGGATPATTKPRNPVNAELMADFVVGVPTPYEANAGSGSGGGGGGGGGFNTGQPQWNYGAAGGGGGGSGSHAGNFFISAKNIVLSGSGNLFEFIGGQGGNGGNGGNAAGATGSVGGAGGGGGAGAGGNGGSGVLIYANITGTLTYSLAGGAPGSVGSSGSPSSGGGGGQNGGVGSTGNTGTLYTLSI